ncbi:hypothetical protein CZ765_01440 [Corynebacterium casei]|nr:hypothetical protein CZ765_01440 [Corynebacterium casei]
MLLAQRERLERLAQKELLERKAHLVQLEERLRLGPLAHLELRELLALRARLVKRPPPAVLLQMELPADLLSSELMEQKTQEQLVLQERLA